MRDDRAAAPGTSTGERLAAKSYQLGQELFNPRTLDCYIQRVISAYAPLMRYKVQKATDALHFTQMYLDYAGRYNMRGAPPMPPVP